MHEFALAEAVLATALREARRAGITEIRRIDVAVGELQGISREAFEFALCEVLPPNEPRLSAAEIRLRVAPARFRCRPCGRAWALADASRLADDEAEAMHFVPELAHAFLRCPDCRSPDFEVLEGRGVTIDRIEGEAP